MRIWDNTLQMVWVQMYFIVIIPGKHLFPWREMEKSRLIDRYDVRNLLDDEKQFVFTNAKKRKLKDPANDEKQYDAERFHDLFHQSDDEDLSPNEDAEQMRERKDLIKNVYGKFLVSNSYLKTWKVHFIQLVSNIKKLRNFWKYLKNSFLHFPFLKE
jgi:hypothetical protein